MCYEMLGAKPALHNKGFPKMRFVLPTALCLLAVPVMVAHAQKSEVDVLNSLMSEITTDAAKLRVTIDDRNNVIGALGQQNAGLKNDYASLTKDRDSVKASNDTLTKQVADLTAKLDEASKDRDSVKASNEGLTKQLADVTAKLSATNTGTNFNADGTPKK